VSNEDYQRLAEQAEEWRRLALSMQQPQQYTQPAEQRASSYQDTTPSYPPATLALENPDEYDRRMQAYMAHRDQQTLSQVASFAAPQLADSGRFMSQNDPEYKDVWSKYGSEIEQEMVRNNVPAHMRTKQAWDLVAKLVRGNHWRELATELADQRLQGGGFGTEGSSAVGGSPASAGDPLSTFWNSGSAWVEKAKATGMTLQSLRAHITRQGIPEQQWVDDMNKGRSFSASAA
jgi:hypothetical protein